MSATSISVAVTIPDIKDQRLSRAINDAPTSLNMVIITSLNMVIIATLNLAIITILNLVIITTLNLVIPYILAKIS